MAQANENSIFMLPKLSNNEVQRMGAGMWNRQSPQAFNDVALSIDVIVNTDVANVNSIPSMWAHPLSLEAILPSTAYNDRIRTPLIKQWRGMLTAIALAPDFEKIGRLTAESIDLIDPRYPTNKFIQSLIRLVPNPENCLFELTNNVGNQLNPWLKGYIFRWNNLSTGKSQAIGMTSPSTIVCPSEDGDWTGLPWFVDEQVQSPEKYLSPDQKLRLSRWLLYVRRKIAAQPMGLCGAVSSLINDFINDLGGIPARELNPTDDLVADQRYFGVLMDLGIYAAINQPLENPIEKELERTFLPELYFLKRPDAFPNAELPASAKNLAFSGSPISLILPIKSGFFSSPNASAAMQTLAVGSLRAGTALKLSMSVNGYDLEKEYELKSENAITGLPIADIWPNFVHSDWKIYYAYSYDVDRTQLSFDFPNLENPQANVHCFNSNLSKLSKLHSFPTHIICSFNNKVIGSIPLRVPETIQSNGTQWTVGVDFGTSFTNAYKKENGVDEKISFEDLHYRISTGDDDARVIALTDNFIPLEQKLPIASLLSVKDGRNQVRNNSDREPEMLFDARIYSLQAPRKVEEGKSFLIGNLKWNSVQNQEPMRLFIEQLALQISAQAMKMKVADIQWALSYPTAFSKRDKRSYVNIWNECSDKLSLLTGLAYGQLAIANVQHFRSESLAFARYFAAKKNKNLVSAACIDIGGGTSDISIWEKQGSLPIPVYQCSVQLAGKDLFSNIVKRNPEFLNDIKLANDDTLVKLRENPSLFASAMDALAKERGEDWLKNQRRKLQDNERLYGYLQILAIGIAGLHYYVGLVLQVLHREDINNTRRYEAGEPVDVYFGGNGCRLLNWLSDTGKFDGDEIGDLFQSMVLQASKFGAGAGTNAVSDKPKEEAACGLVVDGKKLGSPASTEDELIAGESCTIGSHRFEWDSSITLDASLVGNIKKFEVAKSPEELVNLPQFLYWFHKGLKSNQDIIIPSVKDYSLGDPSKTEQENLDNTIQDNSILWKRVVKQLQGSLVPVEDADNIRLEPPFILALKALIEVLAEDWANQ